MTVESEPKNKSYDSVLSAIKESPETIGSGSFWGHRVVVVKNADKWEVVSKNFIQKIFYYIFQASTSKNTLNNELKKAESINLNDDQLDKIKAAIGFILGINADSDNTFTLKNKHKIKLNAYFRLKESKLSHQSPEISSELDAKEVISNQLNEIFKTNSENIPINDEKYILEELQKLKSTLPDDFSFTTYDPITLGLVLVYDPSFLKYVPQDIEIKVDDEIFFYKDLIYKLLEKMFSDENLSAEANESTLKIIKSCLPENFILETDSDDIYLKANSLDQSFPIKLIKT